MNEILRNPATVKGLAEEIKKLADMYWGRKITEKDARQMLIYWSKNEGEKLFKGPELNSTVTKIIGKKRTNLINKWLEGSQLSLL